MPLSPSLIHCQALQWGPTGRPLTPPLDLQLPVGSLTGVVGTNGVGKSSLLKVMAGLQKPLSGSISLPSSQGVGYLVQQQAIDRQFPISLGELVSAGFWGQKVSRQQRRERLQHALEQWQLQGLAERHLQALSGGELQRALLARLSLTQANLLLLDEPDASLDEPSQALLWERIGQWHGEGRTLVVVCHDLGAVQHHTEHCLTVAKEGCILQCGPVRKSLVHEQRRA